MQVFLALVARRRVNWQVGIAEREAFQALCLASLSDTEQCCTPVQSRHMQAGVSNSGIWSYVALPQRTWKGCHSRMDNTTRGREMIATP